jgi:hypothetical protein
VHGVPLARFLCHCTICQQQYRQPFVDVTVFWAGAVALAPDHRIVFKKYRPPPALQRGTCPSCGSPVVGFLRIAPFLRLGFIASQKFRDRSALPAPGAHIFYHSRVAEQGDDLPKYSGYWPSELAVVKLMLRGSQQP